MTIRVESMKNELDLMLEAFKLDLKKLKKEIIEYKHGFYAK